MVIATQRSLFSTEWLDSVYDQSLQYSPHSLTHSLNASHSYWTSALNIDVWQFLVHKYSIAGNQYATSSSVIPVDYLTYARAWLGVSLGMVLLYAVGRWLIQKYYVGTRVITTVKLTQAFVYLGMSCIV